jgi:hypothetical protein
MPILLVLALICFVFAAIGISSKINLEALGLAFWVASSLSGTHFAFNENLLILLVVVLVAVALIVMLSRLAPKKEG